MNQVKAIWPILRQVSTPRVILLLVIMITSSASEGIGILLLVPLLQSLQSQYAYSGFIGESIQWLEESGISQVSLVFMAALFVLITFKAFLQYMREYMGIRLQHHLVDHLRQQAFQGLLHVEWYWLVRQRRSDHATTLLTDINRVGIGFNFALSLLSSIITLIVYIFVALKLSWPVASLALLSAALLLGILSGQRRRALRLGQELSTANQTMQATVQESLSGIKLAKILRQESYFLIQFKQAIGDLRRQQLSFQSDTSLAKACFQIGGAALLMSYIWAGISIWHLEFAFLLTLVIVFSRMIPLFMSAHQQLHQCLHCFSAAIRARQQLESYLKFAEPDDNMEVPLLFEHSITLQNVSLQYPETSRPAVYELSFTIPHKTTTAVTGHSGSGKSTFADLLMGLLVPDDGLILIDGEPLSEEQRLPWRKQVAYVPQDVFLFHDSIRANLLLACPGATEQQLRLVLKHAAADFVFELPDGLDSQIGDGGILLSGGERQRLALARALLQKPSLLILDEATSALDIENEVKICQAIEHLHGELTVVIIGHRTSMLEQADQVLQFGQGQLIAQEIRAEVKASSSTA